MPVCVPGANVDQREERAELQYRDGDDGDTRVIAPVHMHCPRKHAPTKKDKEKEGSVVKILAIATIAKHLYVCAVIGRWHGTVCGQVNSRVANMASRMHPRKTRLALKRLHEKKSVIL